MSKSNTKHHKQQQKYFNTYYSHLQEYSLLPWQESYIQRIKTYILDRNYKQKTLLDIGTGIGYIAIEMAKLGMHVIACDMSEQAMNNLEKYKKQFALKNLELILCKAEEIPLKKQSVDYIISNAILEHIPNEEKAIKAWKSLLKRNGKMFITVPIKFRYVWPFLWLPFYIRDKQIGHLRRYDLPTLQKKIKLPVLKFFYTGHLIKVLGVLILKLTRSDKSKYDRLFEVLDKKKEQKQYGANNISVIFQK